MKVHKADITIDGKILSTEEVMTIRVALNNFYMDLLQDGLGEDEAGKAITAGYLKHIRRLLKLITEGN